MIPEQLWSKKYTFKLKFKEKNTGFPKSTEKANTLFQNVWGMAKAVTVTIFKVKRPKIKEFDICPETFEK